MIGETLLSMSEILLFGREVDDLDIIRPDLDDAEVRAQVNEAKVATTTELEKFEGTPAIDGVQLNEGDKVLVHLQRDDSENGLYTLQSDGENWKKTTLKRGKLVLVNKGDKFTDTLWRQRMESGGANRQSFRRIGRRRGLGNNQFLDSQITKDSRFARIYGFSWEGVYHELPHPTLFLVEGDGESVTDNLPPNQGARAPRDPSATGVGTADFQFSNDVRVWAYDKSDFTIRMDVESGMFEQVLLEVFYGSEMSEVSGGRVAGGRVAGGRVAGGRVAGGRVAGGRVAGGRVSGGRVSGSD